MQICSWRFHHADSIVRIPWSMPFRRASIARVSSCGFHRANSNVQILLCMRIPSCTFHCACGFHHAGSFVPIPSCRFYCASSISEVQLCRFPHAGSMNRFYCADSILRIHYADFIFPILACGSIVQTASCRFHRKILDFLCFNLFLLEFLQILSCAFRRAPSSWASLCEFYLANSIVRIPLCKFRHTNSIMRIPLCGFHRSHFIMRFPSCKFHVKIPSCEFYCVNFIMQMPSCGFYCASSIIQIPSCAFRRGIY